MTNEREVAWSELLDATPAGWYVGQPSYRISDDPPVLIEARPHQGRPKSAQKQKVMTDALKLVWAEAVLAPHMATGASLLAELSTSASERSWDVVLAQRWLAAMVYERIVRRG